MAGTELRVLIQTPQKSGYETCDAFAHALEVALCDAGQFAETNKEITNNYSLVVSVSGDGKMMHTVTQASRHGIPTLGVNGGDVGFLTSADVSELDQVVKKILTSDYEVEQRMGLLVKHRGRSFGPYANEVLLKDAESIGNFEVAINGFVYYPELIADGVMVATATGSTGYNVSAGGPLISPLSRHVSIVAINPTKLSNRPYIADELAHNNGQVTLTFLGSRHGATTQIRADGRLIVSEVDSFLESGESIMIMRHPTDLLFATFGRGGYIKALHEKKGFAQ